MTPRFEVPPPSIEAIRAFKATEGEHVVTRVAAVLDTDVPHIVRAEVEAALEAVREGGPYEYADGAYLRDRFPEAATEPKRVYPCNEPECVKCRTYEGHPTPTVPAEPESLWGNLEPIVEQARQTRIQKLREDIIRRTEELAREVAAPPSEAPAKGCERNCQWPDKLCDTSCVAAAQPEAERCEPGCPLPHPHPICTACACERCSNERAFVRELAKLSSLASLGRYPNEALVRAAAKVSE